jgi:hypothetical protein
MVDGEIMPAATAGLDFDSELYMLQLVPWSIQMYKKKMVWLVQTDRCVGGGIRNKIWKVS